MIGTTGVLVCEFKAKWNVGSGRISLNLPYNIISPDNFKKVRKVINGAD